MGPGRVSILQGGGHHKRSVSPRGRDFTLGFRINQSIGPRKGFDSRRDVKVREKEVIFDWEGRGTARISTKRRVEKKDRKFSQYKEDSLKLTGERGLMTASIGKLTEIIIVRRS